MYITSLFYKLLQNYSKHQCDSNPYLPMPRMPFHRLVVGYAQSFIQPRCFSTHARIAYTTNSFTAVDVFITLTGRHNNSQLAERLHNRWARACIMNVHSVFPNACALNMQTHTHTLNQRSAVPLGHKQQAKHCSIASCVAHCGANAKKKRRPQNLQSHASYMV